MRSFTIFLIVTVFTAMMTGCGVRIYTNIPAHGTLFTVFNETGYNLRVVNDGRVIVILAPNPPNDFFPMVRRNFHTTSAESSVTVTAISNGQSIGSASRTFSINGYYRQSQDWVVTKDILRR